LEGKVGDSTCWDLTNFPKIFGLENGTNDDTFEPFSLFFIYQLDTLTDG
jgi:hypothetical protein